MPMTEAEYQDNRHKIESYETDSQKLLKELKLHNRYIHIFIVLFAILGTCGLFVSVKIFNHLHKIIELFN